MVSRLLNAVLYTLSGVHNHSTVFLARNRAMGLHSDTQNHQDVPNVLIPLSAFSGGQLFVESEEGDACLDHQGKVRGYIYIYPITLPFFVFRCTEAAFDSSLVRLQTDPRVFSHSRRR